MEADTEWCPQPGGQGRLLRGGAVQRITEHTKELALGAQGGENFRQRDSRSTALRQETTPPTTTLGILSSGLHLETGQVQDTPGLMCHPGCAS